jgi:hypothetical protein
MPQAEVLQNIEIGLADDMMRFVYQHELESRRVKLGQSVARCDALYGGNRDVGGARGLDSAHLEVHMLVGVCEAAMAGGLFDEFAAVGEDERLRGMASGRYAVDEVGEYDCLARARGQRHPQALMADVQV